MSDPFRLVRQYNARCNAQDVINRELYLDTRFMMSDSVLMKVDKMSMAHSLEVRVPMLDHKFVELNASLPGVLEIERASRQSTFSEKRSKDCCPITSSCAENKDTACQ